MVVVWQPLFIISGLFSIVIGTLMAFRQVKVRRFLAYSSIANMGFIVIFLSCFTFESLHYCIIFLIVYIHALLSFWSVILMIEGQFNQILDNFTDYGGLYRTNRVL